MYPFGRRQFTAELLPLLETAHQARPKPVILASVRDILTERRDPERSSEMARLALRWYRAVLVHSDPELIPFETSFPETARISHLIRYTGYVGAVGPGGPYGASQEVIVSAGGGGGGQPGKAQAGGRDGSKVKEAVGTAESVVRQMIAGA